MPSDLAIAFRGLRRSPGFAGVAVMTLALGIGANTTMFSVINAVLLRPLPGYQTDRLVRILDIDRGGGLGYVDPDAYLQLRGQSHSFEQVAGLQFRQLNLTGLGEPEQLGGPCTTANWFELQRAQAMLGRTFLPDEDRHGSGRVVVLDHGFWKRRLGGDPKIVGKTLTLNKEPWLVIGVMPPDFRPLGATDNAIFTPFVLADDPGKTNLYVAARLKPGVTIRTAQAEMNVIAERLARANPTDWKNIKFHLTPVLEQLTGPQRPLLLLLLGAVSLVLLIACVNVANLLLARSTARRHEMDIRIALGATRARIARFVLAESLLLSTAASVAAVAMAYGGLRALRPLTGSLPRADELSVDGRVLLCALALGIVAALLFGMVPAIRASRPPRPRTASRWPGALLASEVALAFVLLIGAGLLIRTFVNIRATHLGYDPRNVLTNFLALPAAPDGSRTAGAGLYARIRERLAAVGGVQAVATATAMPMGGVLISMDVQPEGQPARRQDHRASVDVISDNYFQVTRIPLGAGRRFSSSDRDGSTPVVVVSQSIANRYFGGNAIGRRIVLPEFGFNLTGDKEIANEIVGVVGDVCVNSVADCEAEHIYLPESQDALRLTYILVRTEGEPLALAKAVSHAVYLESPATPLDEARSLEDRTRYLTDGPKRAMWLLTVFAGLALVLAAIGIYGVSAYLAAQRRQEIGIRMALGASFGDITELMYRGSLVAAVAGLGIGGAASWAVTRLVKSLLFGVGTLDPSTFIAAGGALLVTAVLATAWPAARAALIDPARVLRRE